MAGNVTKGGYELVKIGVDSRTTDQFDLGLWLTPVRHALYDLLVRLTDERVEEVVQRILADRLQLVGVLVMARLGAVVDMALARGPAGRSLRLALCAAAVDERWRQRSAGEAIRSSGAGRNAVRGKGRRYGVLRHDGSIEGCDDVRLRAEGAGGGRVHEARVARVLDAMHDRGVAVVGIRLRVRGLALEATVWTRSAAAAAARDGDAGRPGA